MGAHRPPALPGLRRAGRAAIPRSRSWTPALELPEGTRLHVLAPVAPARAATTPSCSRTSRVKGFARVQVDGTVYPLAEAPELRRRDEHRIELVVDRLAARASARRRITDSVETALRLGAGWCAGPGRPPRRTIRPGCPVSPRLLSCPNGHPLAVAEIEPRSFSFNSPFGACPVVRRPRACAGSPTSSWSSRTAAGRWRRARSRRGPGGRSATTSSGCWPAAATARRIRPTPRGTSCPRPPGRRCCTARATLAVVRRAAPEARGR